jgi:hypothetical protein
MRINGRTLRASDLRERRVLLALGIDPALGLKVPRSENPFMVARHVRRLAAAANEDMSALRALVEKTRREPRPSPEVDLPHPMGEPCGLEVA